MTIWAERTQIIGEIQAKAKQEELRNYLAFVIALFPLLLGWLAAKVMLLVLFLAKGSRYLIAAVKVGYQEGMKTRGSG